jgi:hypothetical protein
MSLIFPPRSLFLRTLLAMLVALAVGGCSYERLTGLMGSSSETPQEGAPGAPAAPADAPALSTPPFDMAGKWTLASPGAGSCVMTFGGNAGASEGTIAPAGGCPFSFFTSRKWTYEEKGLVVRDHTGQQLATLTAIDRRAFEGRTAANQTITLRGL